jgi:DsbE subfamily thiol:disulfide oxidoreductase
MSVLLTACPKVTATPTTGTGVITENKPFPQLVGTTLAGAKFDTASLAGKPFVLNVWATWCAPCAREQPALRQLATTYKGRVGFLGINYRDDDAAAKAWVEQFGVPYPSLTDPSGKYAADLAFPFLPDTYVVDATGRIRYVVFGETSQQQLTGLLDSLLASSGPGSSSATPS